MRNSLRPIPLQGGGDFGIILPPNHTCILYGPGVEIKVLYGVAVWQNYKSYHEILS